MKWSKMIWNHMKLVYVYETNMKFYDTSQIIELIQNDMK